MSLRFDENFNIVTYKGDTIIFDIEDLPNDLPYTIYFGVYDDAGNAIIPETQVNAEYRTMATIEVKPWVTDGIAIPNGKKSVTYRYALKACNFDAQVEHTLQVGTLEVGEETKITFMRKEVEGIVTWFPAEAPTEAPTSAPTSEPTSEPTDAPSETPSEEP